MLQDALLAWIHYLAIFVLVVVMTAEAVLLRSRPAPDTVRRLAPMTAFTAWRLRWPRACCA